MKVFALDEGSFSVGVDKKFIPFDPKTDDKNDRKGSLFINVKPFLVDAGNDLIIIDTGLGFSKNGQMMIHENIRELGYEPEDVTLVLMSHLHQDHASGMINSETNTISFTNAEYIIQRAEWEEAYSDTKSSYRTEVFDILQRSGQVHFVENNGELNSLVSYEISGAHSPYHQVFHIKNEEDHLFYGGDEWPEPEQALRRFAAKYDYDGHKAMELREQYATQATNEDWTCLFYHAGENAIARMAKKDDSFRIIPV